MGYQAMTERERIAHILRRFGLGASRAELDFYEKLGVEGALDRLINYEKHDEGFDVSVWEFANRNNDRINLAPPHVVQWWTLRMLVTERPLQEKLTLFWHDHFAISGSKVGAGPMIHLYLETLRKNANGNFHTMLKDISRDPAMILWLDSNTNVRGKPNENFAREVMELFTLGVDGGYTEKDIQEAARAFTGWAFRRAGPPRRRRRQPTLEEQLEAIKKGEPFVEFFFRAALHDNGTKTVLGNTGRFGGDDILGILVAREETARYVTTKLWEWFAYPEPEKKVQDKLVRTYLDNGFEIKPILRTIAESDEFWSEKCVRKQVKNPVDFTVALCRQFGLGPQILQFRRADAGPTTQLPREVRGLPGAVAQMLNKQGMSLLYPPDVAGWDWGTAWISSATMVERIQLSQTLFNQRRGGVAPIVSQAIQSEFSPGGSEEVVDAVLDLVDAKLTGDRKSVLVKACEGAGGVQALSNPRSAGRLLGQITKVLFAAPEFHFC
ncbi:MAG: DUF1800 domain-containing protein [Armatimonadetes bacterium]|nr:DUF1800 domain-containing protein [Armatimonadota bacterium]